MNATKKQEELRTFTARIQFEIDTLDEKIIDLNREKKVLLNLLEKAKTDTDVLIQSIGNKSTQKIAVQNKIVSLLKKNPPFMRSQKMYYQSLLLFPDLKESTFRSYTKDLKTRGIIEKANFTNGCWKLTQKDV